MKIKIKRKIDKQKQFSDEQIIDFLLKDRGIKHKEDFLNPKCPEKISFNEFFSKKEFDKVIKKLKEIKEKGGMVVVYTDYDADGITGGAILWETLHLLGFKAMPYVPYRKLEGYGFSKKGIDKIKKLYNPSLIISVDHGISAAEKISYAKSLGISIIITDHHMKSAKKPDDALATSDVALAIFHTDKLSGSGVAYFFAKEIFSHFYKTSTVKNTQGRTAAVLENSLSGTAAVKDNKKTSEVNWKLLENNFSFDYLSLASIGTIADLVPLLGPSRSITKYGLEAFPKVGRMGIKHILKEAGIENRKITPYEIGFIIAPRINALGRLEHAIDALRLLCTSKEEKAQMLAAKIGEKNRERQDLVGKTIEEAKKIVSSQWSSVSKMPKIIILSSDKWHEGIIGLIASKLVDEFYRPTIIMAINDGFAKGSARSISGFDVTLFLRSQKKYLVDIGGHKAAAGFTIEKDKIDKFIKKAEKDAGKILTEKNLEREIKVDLAIPLSKINISLVKKIESLEPFGIGNPQPLFYSEGKLVDAKLFGKNNNHLKIYLKDDSSFPLEFVFFGQGQDFLKLSRGQKIAVVHNLEIDRWRGKEKIRGKGKIIQAKFK